MARTIMIQGAGSNVGKSLLVAGLCRAFWKRGLGVRPFKPQNMSNNAAVTIDGGEIGRAQALQARAANIDAHSDMNPVLLKPETETGAQIVLQGSRLGSVKAGEYGRLKARLLPAVMESYHRLARQADLVIVEGAGSPAEINLRSGDIANMGFAEAADIPVILVGDIDRGGVIAQIVGTHAVLSPDDRNRIRGFLINKFRGDVRLFDGGLDEIVSRTDWHAMGVVPWLDEAARLPAEDVMDIRRQIGPAIEGGDLRIIVPRLSRISNFDDLDPLRLEPGVSVEIIEPGTALPCGAHLVLIPGTKSTIAELRFFRSQGWDIDLAAHLRQGGQVLGICGGYQMLGREVIDREGLEGPPGRVPGLGHLDVVTEIGQHKHLANVHAEYVARGIMLTAYEIHMGRTTGPDHARAWLTVGRRREGAQSPDGRVQGCYLHGMFASDRFRTAWLERVRAEAPGIEIGAGTGAGTGADTGLNYSHEVESALDGLAAHLEEHVDLDLLLTLAR